MQSIEQALAEFESDPTGTPAETVEFLKAMIGVGVDDAARVRLRVALARRANEADDRDLAIEQLERILEAAQERGDAAAVDLYTAQLNALLNAESAEAVFAERSQGERERLERAMQLPSPTPLEEAVRAGWRRHVLIARTPRRRILRPSPVGRRTTRARCRRTVTRRRSGAVRSGTDPPDGESEPPPQASALAAALLEQLRGEREDWREVAGELADIAERQKRELDELRGGDA